MIARCKQLLRTARLLGSNILRKTDVSASDVTLLDIPVRLLIVGFLRIVYFLGILQSSKLKPWVTRSQILS